MTQGEGVLHYLEVSSPIGSLVLVANSRGLCSIKFGTFANNQEKLQIWAIRWLGPHNWQENEVRLRPVALQLEQYFRGERSIFEGSLDLHGTDFQKRVWQALLTVPYGKTASYKDIAEAIGSPKAVRAVGGANNQNPISIIVPCHRVIGASGELVGYGGGLDTKVTLLALEGMLANKTNIVE
ncbi:methylated-DNA--[protein]-cysteine S-methyltransferase [Paenibacillus sp. SYP-B3998]|uniref:Methylated-DNA--protein-cysteine methyltransferase n=1 Tax=Paenibacillus sp. SYP-B3998 TaxID=2678564 RepID=A0A6G4A339_9BACL|nr:methylated-DNA--[protein]-cysteine S-methyltransferase [Paenibacillus sp. SYP-B3998]NEW08067.1 methylated-DNA--[protein]-cysteine S-methyltransferase [Paenibacillus sp. SYP-B3998]